MATPFNVYQGGWWRFSKYELRDGYIRPAPKAQLEIYDPWAAYQSSWEYDPESATPYIEQRTSAPPYQSLLALLQEFRFDALGKPDLESAEKLLAWCSEHGLLGLLPQRTQMVTLAVRWYPPGWGPMLGEKPKPPKDGKLSLIGFQYFRQNAVVRLRGWYALMLASQKTETGHKLGELGKKSRGALRPHALIQDMRPLQNEGLMSTILTPSYYEEPLSQTWGNFFPDVPKNEKDTYLYPIPLSDAFWHLYAESVDDFLAGAIVLAKAVDSISHNAGGEGWYSDEGVSLLNNLVSSASMMVRPGGDTYIQEWRTPSLLASYAVMALQDLTQQRRLLNCETCNKPFITDAYQARYCSDTCRHTAQKRRYRQKLKQKEEQHNEQASPKAKRSTGQRKRKQTA
jgi:hypothetical protein